MTSDDRATAAGHASVGGSHSRQVLIVAGEASGDMHAARLIEEIRRRRPDVTFFGIGGERMKEQGVRLHYDAAQMNVVGFIEVVKRYSFFRRVFRQTVELARQQSPSFAILVDYPGFNLRLALKLRSLRIPVIYYIAPQVWAWKEGRVNAMRRYIDDLIVVFPFEVAYFARHGITAHFFGHPLVDQLAAGKRNERPMTTNREKRTIAYLPGSRPEELRRHMPIICEVINRMGTGYRHLIPLAPTLDRSTLLEFSKTADFEILDDAREALRNADAAVVKSGTSTVEAALLRVPFAVIYKTSNLSYQIARRAIKVSSIAMVNLLAGRKVVREFIQSEVEPSPLVEELHRLLEDKVYRHSIRTGLRRVASELGNPGAARRAADYIVDRYL